jgi:hypothetical protein
MTDAACEPNIATAFCSYKTLFSSLMSSLYYQSQIPTELATIPIQQM